MPKSIEKEGNNIAEHEWKLWCRLCARENSKNIVLIEQEQASAPASTDHRNIHIIGFIEEYFRINMENDRDLPQLLCTQCVSLISALIKFVDHVKQVQNMYDAIRLTEEWKPIDLRMLREKYNLHEDDIYTFKMLHHNDSTKSSIEKVFLADAPDTVIQNSLDTIVKCEISTDEVPSGLFINNAEDRNEFEDPIGDVNDNLSSENESYDSESKINISNNLKVELSEKGKGKGRVREYKKNTISSEPKLVDKKYFCAECSIHYQQSGNYRTHMKKKHGKVEEPLTCTECPKTFESRNKLNRHTKTHRPAEEKKVFPCPKCERKFQTKDYVAKHIKFVHEDVRPFICEECGEAVRTEATLREHMLIHTDYAPYVCDICKKGFKNQYRLKSHKEIHSFNKYICSECGLQLNSRVTLNRHMLVHSDVLRHKCEYCGRAFKRAKSLKSHLILHSGLKPYSCDFCDKTFANGANCRSHKRKSHPEELAALEASGEKTYTKNIPKLSVLKAVTRSAENLIPVVTKQSGNFSSGKRPKPSPHCPGETNPSKIHKPVYNASSVGNESMEKVLTSSQEGLNENKLDAGSSTTANSIPSSFW